MNMVLIDECTRWAEPAFITNLHCFTMDVGSYILKFSASFPYVILTKKVFFSQEYIHSNLEFSLASSFYLQKYTFRNSNFAVLSIVEILLKFMYLSYEWFFRAKNGSCGGEKIAQSYDWHARLASNWCLFVSSNGDWKKTQQPAIWVRKLSLYILMYCLEKSATVIFKISLYGAELISIC